MKDTFADVRVARRLILAHGAVVQLERQAGPPIEVTPTNLSGGYAIITDAGIDINAAGSQGRTYFLDRATGIAIGLPDPVAGFSCKFVVKTISTSGGYVFTSAGGANIIAVAVAGLDGNAGVEDDNADTVTLTANNHAIGDTLSLECDGTLYYLSGVVKAAAGLTTATT